MMSDTKVAIKDLYKIFGSNPSSMIDKVKNGISKSDLLENYGHVLGLDNVNIEVKKSQLQVIMGLSGSGKSTLIRHINRLIEPTSGSIVVDGDDILSMNQTELRNFRRSKASMVFQKFGLLPHRKIIENVSYGLTIQGINKKEAYERSNQWIESVGLNGFENHYPAQLSGGMQQRVGIARALANDAPILLMDEPFSALDPLIRIEMQDMLITLQKELKKTIIFITHDLDEALKLGDNIAILRDGKIIQSGTGQDIILNPYDSYISNFTAQVNRGKVIECEKVMKKLSKDTFSNVTITKETKLEEAVRVMISNNINEVDVLN